MQNIIPVSEALSRSINCHQSRLSTNREKWTYIFLISRFELEVKASSRGYGLLHQESSSRNVTIANKGSYDYIYSLHSRNAVQQTNASVGGHCFTPAPVSARQRHLPVFPGLPGCRRGLLPRLSGRWDVKWSASHL